MKRFEEFVVTSWEEWDDIGDGYVFGGCDLNPEFFIGKEDDLKDIYALQEIHNIKPYVQFTFADTGFYIQIDLAKDIEDEWVPIKTWAYEGVISRGKSIEPQN